MKALQQHRITELEGNNRMKFNRDKCYILHSGKKKQPPDLLIVLVE